MNVLLNNTPHKMQSVANLAELVKSLNIDTQQLAAAVNRTIVPKSQWRLFAITENDSIDLFSTIAGG